MTNQQTGTFILRKFVDPNRLMYWVFLALFLEIMSYFGGAKPSLYSFSGLLLFVVVIVSTGETVMRFCMQAEGEPWPGMSFIIGMATLSIPMMLITLYIQISALSSFIISFAGILLLSTIKKPSPRLKECQFSDILNFAILMLIVGFASRVPAGSFVSVVSGGEFNIWSDYYLHGITIDSFVDSLSNKQGNPFLVFSPKTFYHYAAFVLSAATIPITGLSGTATATALLLPMGLLMAISGLYSLAAELGGRLVAVLSIMVILCLPEPSVITKVGFFAFYWLLFTSPASGCAIGVACVACVVLNRFLINGNRATGCLSMFLLFSLILIRAHMFLLMAPAFFYLLLVNHFSKHKKTICIGSFCLVIASLLVISQYIPAYNYWVNNSMASVFLSWTLSTSPYYADLHNLVISTFPRAALGVELLLVLTAAFGVFVVVFPTLDLIRRHFISRPPGTNNLIEFLPWLLIISFVGLVLFAPTARNGDLTEYKHRAFVLLYPIIVIFSVHAAVKIAAHFKFWKQVSRQTECGLLFLSLLFVSGWTFTHNPARPMINEMPWAGTVFDQKTSPGVIEISKFIKLHSGPGDILAFDSDSTKERVTGPAIETIALTGMPAYVSTTGLFVMAAPDVKTLISDRLKILSTVESAKDWELAKNILNKNGIRWYVRFNQNDPEFDLGKGHATFQSAGITVYDVKKAG